MTDADVVADRGVPLFLRVAHLRKVFGGTIALADGNLEARPGEIHGLLGENGSGKSTLIKILAGAVRADGGTITVSGVDLPPSHDPEAARSAGLAFIHQDPGLIPDLSVAENVALAVGYAKRGWIVDWKGVRERAVEVLANMGVDLDPDRLVAELPLATRSIVAIARSLAGEPRVLFLDEPTASLAAGEVRALFRVLRNLRDRGLAIVFVSHRMDEIYDLCDRVTVLRDGRTVGSEPVTDISHEDLLKMIVGRHLPRFAAVNAPDSTGTPYLVAKDLAGLGVGPISFSVSKGEILGVTGLSDSGHHELADLVFGTADVIGGDMTLEGEPYSPRSPVDAITRGVFYTPRDRSEGTATGLSLQENLFANPSDRYAAFEGSVLIRPRRERSAARTILHQFDVRPPEPDRELSTLSGGNAQKVMLARSLAANPQLMVLNELTSGVDVGARADIHQMVRDQVAGGGAALIITSDFEEAAQLCHRVLVLHRGSLSRELVGGDIEESLISTAALAPN